MAIEEHTLDWHELKQAYIDATIGNKRTMVKRTSNKNKINDLVSGWKSKKQFYGCSSHEVNEWLHKGYRQPGLTLDPPIEPVRKRRRLTFAEEGELQLDLVWSGHDYPWLQWTPREIMPGMKIDIMYNFVAMTRVEDIIAYCRFVLRSLIALEAAGIDLEVWISSISSNIFQGNYTGQLYNKVRVKREGEQTDYLGWSAMVSPGGFRHLMFLDYVISADQLGYDVSYGLGHGTNSGQRWKVAYDPDHTLLSFKCPWHPHGFPEKEMEIELRTVLKEARRAA